MSEAENNPYVRDYPRMITLEWLVDQQLPVFVRNITRPRGQVAVNFPSAHGRVKVVKIPRTHLPVGLSQRLSYETILGSDDFRDCVSKGVLEVLRPDEAWVELQDPDNQATVSQLQLSAFSAKNAFVSRRVADMEKTVEDRVDPYAAPVDAFGIETHVISPRVLRFVEQTKSGDLSVKAALNEIKTMEAELKDTDCSYIIANGPDGQLRTYVQRILAGIQGTQTAEHSVAQDDDLPPMTSEEQILEEQRAQQARTFQDLPLKQPPTT